MGKITIQEIANKLTAQNGLSKKEATLFTNMMFDLIREALERDKLVKVKGLGTFKIIDVDSRESVNVNTGERVLIEGHNKITFLPDTLMKELVNKPFSQFETVVLNDGVDFKDAPKEEEETKAEEADVEEGDGEMEQMPLVDFVSGEESAKQQDDIADEDIPEWVIEPYVTHPSAPPVEQQKPIDLGTPAEPEVTTEPEIPVDPEPAPVVEPEIPAEPEKPVEPETPAEPETPVEEAPETEEESEPSVEEEPDVETFADLEDEEEEPAYKRWMWPLACVLALVIGYLLGNYLPFCHQTDSKETVTPKVEKVVPAEPAAQPVKPEVKPVEEKAEKEAVSQVEEPKEQEKPEAQKQPETQKQPEAKAVETKAPEVKTPEAKAPEVPLDKYELKDSRVKNGAYRIIGTDHVEIVKEGDNLQRICKRTIGPGMECYIEVYNDINATTELKKGMQIKIPKVELKKKKKVQK